jgi:protein-S-isoprenylcysteine O-methyltransferase Ste14
MADTGKLLDFLWVAFLAYWIIAARGAQPKKTTEAPASVVRRLLVNALGFTLLFAGWGIWGPLNRRWIAYDRRLVLLGLAITVAGLALAVWARRHLGQYWSHDVVLKADHQLVRSGPYARIRHPIYSGVLLAMAGSTLAIGRWRGLLGFAIVLASYLHKSRCEDALLASEFGPQFAEHRRRTGLLLPRFRQS